MKRFLLLSILLLACFSAAVVGQEDGGGDATTTSTPTPDKCFQGFGVLHFQFNNFDRYDEFFRNDSQLINWQAGTYTGAKNIEEYTRFLSPTNTFISVADGYHRPGLRGIADGLCEFLLLTNSWYTFLPDDARAGSYNVTVMSLIKYDPEENYIKTVVVNLPGALMKPFFGTTLGTDRTHRFVCKIMKESCPDVWEANKEVFANATTSTQIARLADKDDDADLAPCISQMASLPAVTDEVYIDGNSHGCRAVHAFYASTNDLHCPHLSFIPMEDGDGKIKCQKSEGVKQSDYFTEEDIAKFDAFMKENSDRVNYPDGYKITDMEEMQEDVDGNEIAPGDLESSGANLGVEATCALISLASMIALVV